MASIFMAETTISPCPSSTCSPTWTIIRTTLAGMGGVTMPGPTAPAGGSPAPGKAFAIGYQAGLAVDEYLFPGRGIEYVDLVYLLIDFQLHPARLQ